MRSVLIVHQAAELYGSDRAVLMLAQGLLANGRWRPILVVPRAGPLLAALERAGAEVHIAEVMHVSRSTASLAGLARLILGGWRCPAALDRIVAGRQISLVHSNTVAVLGGALWARRRRRPHVWHVHEIVTSPAPARRGFPWLVRQFADRVIANSRQTLDWLIVHQPAIERRARVIFNGVPVPPDPPRGAVRDMRRRLGAGDPDVLVSLVGRLNHWKGQGVLLTALAALKRAGRAGRLRVAIVGSPFAGQEHVLSELVQQCTQLGLDGQVTFASFVDDVWPIWYATDIAVVPSTEPEPFGLVAIEAMAAGVPVVASSHGGLLDIVADGRTGLLVTPRDPAQLAGALDRLASDQSLRRAMGAAGRARQRELFSVETYVAGVEAMYEETVDTSAKL